MTYANSPFHRFRGWHILALLAVTMLYARWYTVVGPYSKLAATDPGMPLEEAGFYSGEYAVTVLSALDSKGVREKYVSLIFDLPFMVLMALSLEALIGFGIRRFSLTRPAWSLLFILPIVCLFVDFAEDAFLALTLATKFELLGSFAGFFTGVKMKVVNLTMLIALGLGIGGLIKWQFDRTKPKASA